MKEKETGWSSLYLSDGVPGMAPRSRKLLTLLCGTVMLRSPASYAIVKAFGVGEVPSSSLIVPSLLVLMIVLWLMGSS